MSPARALALLRIDHHVGLPGLQLAALELSAVGVRVASLDLAAVLRRSGAFQNPVTLEWVPPGACPPTWPYDGLQDLVMDRTGWRGPRLWAAWLRVKGQLRLRWAVGNFARPRAETVVRWAVAS